MPAAAVFLLLTACQDAAAPPPSPSGELGIDSTRPRHGATGVAPDSDVVVFFRGPVNPATLAEGLTVRRVTDSTPVPAVTAYYAPTNSARLTLPLVPGVMYEAEASTAIEDTGRAPFAEPRKWLFGTRPWMTTVLSGAVTYAATQPALAVDYLQRLHGLHDSFGIQLRYYTCTTACELPGNWRYLDLLDYVTGAYDIAVEGISRVHAAYSRFDDAYYATCVASCEVRSNWHTVAIDTTPYAGLWVATVLVSRTGRVHYLYSRGTARYGYAVCDSICDQPASWSRSLLPPDVAPLGTRATAIGPDGRLHVISSATPVRYSVCSADCDDSTSWQSVDLPLGGGVTFGDAMVVVDQDGGLHVAYNGNPEVVPRYAYCAAGCLDPQAWGVVAFPGLAGQYRAAGALAVSVTGRVHLAYTGSGAVQYAVCLTACLDALSWQHARIDSAISMPAFATDAGGRLRAMVHSVSTGTLSYLW